MACGVVHQSPASGGLRKSLLGPFIAAVITSLSGNSQLRHRKFIPHKLNNRFFLPYSGLVTALCFTVFDNPIIQPTVATFTRSLYQTPQSPDWSSPRPIIGLLYLIIFVPIQICTLIGIILRRKTFPVAGRNPYLLGILNVAQIWTIICTSLTLIYLPEGFPCSTMFILYAIYIYTAIICHLGMAWQFMEFLSELRWRQQQRETLSRLSNERKLQREGGFIGKVVDDSESKSDELLAELETKIIESLKDETKIPGYIFTKNRHWMGMPFVKKCVSVFLALVVPVLVFLAAFDPDLAQNTSYFHDDGQLPPGISITQSQFESYGLTHAPACAVFSLKIFVQLVMVVIAAGPTIGWVIFRLIIDVLRRRAREKEKIVFEKNINIIRGIRVETNKRDSAAAVHSAADDASTAISSTYDDSTHAKVENMAVAIFANINVAIHFPFMLFAPDWYPLMWMCIFIPYHFTIANPVYQSIQLARLQRQRILSSTQQSDGNKSVAPHRRRYYNLAFILKDDRSYEVLLTFLRKEYSSENALWLRAAASFSKKARRLEHQLQQLAAPGWMRLDEEEDFRSGAGASRASDGGGRGVSSIGRPSIGTALIPSVAKPTTRVSSVTVAFQNTIATADAQRPQKSPSLLRAESSAASITALPRNSPTLAPGQGSFTGTSPSGIKPVSNEVQSLGLSHVNVLSSSASDSTDRRGSMQRSFNQTQSRRSTATCVELTVNIREQEGNTITLPHAVSEEVADEGAQTDHIPTFTLANNSSNAPYPSPSNKLPSGINIASAIGEQINASTTINLDHASNELLSASLLQTAIELRLEALQLFDDFLAKNARLEVNVSDDVSALSAASIALIRNWDPTAKTTVMKEMGEEEPDRQQGCDSAEKLNTYQRKDSLAAPSPSQSPVSMDDYSSSPSGISFVCPPPTPLSSLFKPSTSAVFDLVSSDSFQRFVLSEGFRSLLREADQEALAKADQQADMQQTQQEIEHALTQAAASV